jgi:hypothetical protein
LGLAERRHALLVVGVVGVREAVGDDREVDVAVGNFSAKKPSR